MSVGRPKSYGFIRTFDGNRPVVRFQCVECAAYLDIQNTMPKSADFYAARAVKKGWAAHATLRAKCYCPKHRGHQQHAPPPPSVFDMMNNPPPPPPPPSRPEMTIVANKGDVSPSTREQMLAAVAVKAREATSEERIKIRRLLDQHFDDSEGLYLDDMSDQAIGKAAGVPWNLVTKIREAAYGPIKIDAAVAALRTQFTELQKTIEADRKRIDEELQKMRVALDAHTRRNITGSAAAS